MSPLKPRNTLTLKTSSNKTDGNNVPSPPGNPGKKPPMYAGDSHNPNDPEFQENQPYAAKD